MLNGLKKIEQLRFLTDDGATLGQKALRYVLREPLVASALPNIYNREQLLEFAAASDVADVTDAQAATIEALYDANYGLPVEQEAGLNPGDPSPARSGQWNGLAMTTTESRPAGASAAPATGKQFVKFSFFRLRDDVRAAPIEDRAALASGLMALIERSAARMLTRTYSTVGTRADTDFLIWQVADDLGEIQDWHGALLGSAVGAALARPHSLLSMTMRSMYSNPLHAGAGGRDRLRDDGGTADYLFVYPNGEDEGLVPAAPGRASGDHERAHRRRAQVPRR